MILWYHGTAWSAKEINNFLIRVISRLKIVFVFQISAQSRLNSDIFKNSSYSSVKDKFILFSLGISKFLTVVMNNLV